MTDIMKKNFLLILPLTICSLITPIASANEPRELWIGPSHVVSQDPNDTTQAITGVTQGIKDMFGLSGGAINATALNQEWGKLGNIATGVTFHAATIDELSDNDELSIIVEKLDEFGFKMGIESAGGNRNCPLGANGLFETPSDESDCGVIATEIAYINEINDESSDIELRIAIDSPLYFNMLGGENFEGVINTAQTVLYYVYRVKEIDPDISIGIIDPFKLRHHVSEHFMTLKNGMQSKVAWNSGGSTSLRGHTHKNCQPNVSCKGLPLVKEIYAQFFVEYNRLLEKLVDDGIVDNSDYLKLDFIRFDIPANDFRTMENTSPTPAEIVTEVSTTIKELKEVIGFIHLHSDLQTEIIVNTSVVNFDSDKIQQNNEDFSNDSLLMFKKITEENIDLEISSYVVESWFLSPTKNFPVDESYTLANVLKKITAYCFSNSHCANLIQSKGPGY